MKSIFIFIAFLLTTSLVGQSTMTIAPDGTVDVTIENVSGKDPVWSGVTLITSKGIRARQASSVSFTGDGVTYIYDVLYNSDTKVYTAVMNDGKVFSSTTKSAVVSATNVDVYYLLTGVLRNS